MGRLIEIQHAPEAPARLTMEVGDLLQFAATGGHVRSGTDVLEMLDPSLPAVVAPHGEIISPLGAPTTVMFVARSPGRATIRGVRSRRPSSTSRCAASRAARPASPGPATGTVRRRVRYCARYDVFSVFSS
jgi:hypothetical protein